MSTTTSTSFRGGARRGPGTEPIPCRKNTRFGASSPRCFHSFPIARNRRTMELARWPCLSPPNFGRHWRGTMAASHLCPSEIGKCCCPWPWVSTAPPHRPAPGHHWPLAALAAPEPYRPWERSERWPGQMSKLQPGVPPLGLASERRVTFGCRPPMSPSSVSTTYKMDMPSSSSSSPFLSSSLRSCQRNQQAFSLFFASSLGTTTLVLYHA
jgi:hypothetical protein